MALKGIVPRWWRRIKKIMLFLFVFQLVYLIMCKWVNPPITITQLSNWVQGYGLYRDYVSYDEINASAKLAAMASEDQLFADHGGFDWKSMQKAMEYNKRKPNRIRGASTISQQVAKNVFLWQGRSYLRKGLEMYFTFMIELIWGKKRILEVYLNVAEMGIGVFGIERAANIYFKKSAASLTRVEAAQIIAGLPNPKIYTVRPMSKFVANKYGWILSQMRNLDDDDDVRKIVFDN
jgi:monofunctional glycosyltransferase